MKLVEYPDQDMMMIDLANVLAEAIENVLLHEDTASLVVPGGTTPGPIFDYLSAADLDWSRVQVMLSDERWVPESSPRSNTRLLKQRLLVGRAADASYLPLYAEGLATAENLAQLAGAITPHLPISVLLLGMGADMHTASLIPGSDRLAEAMDAQAPTLMALRAPGAPERRVTLTAPVLAGALTKHIVITGSEKRAALERARHMNDPMAAPISAVLRGATVHWAE